MNHREWVIQTVKTLRKEQGMTLAEVAERSGLSVSYIHDIEKGRGKPTIEALAALLQAFGKELTLGIEGNPTPAGMTVVSDETLRDALISAGMAYQSLRRIMKAEQGT